MAGGDRVPNELRAEANERRELRRFGFGAATGLALLAVAAHSGRGPFALFGTPHPATSAALACLALWIAGMALLAPHANRWLARVLGALARVLGWLSLVVFFFGVLTPFGAVARRLGHDPLWLRPKNRRDSYWRPHRSRDKASYFHQS